MLKNNHKISSLAYNDAISSLMESKSIDITEARRIISNMSFGDYCRIIEASADIIPPSGKPISVNSPNQQQMQPNQTPTAQPTTQAQLQQPNQTPTAQPTTQAQPNQPQQPNQAVAQQPTNPGQVNQNPQVPGILAVGSNQNMPGAKNVPGLVQQNEDKELVRMKRLAGISEECSSGATGAGSIAVSPASVGTIKRRQQTNEQPKKEYTPRGPAKTIIGDTKPAQASGELSANLAANGKKTASRKNNGFKK